MKWLYRCEFRWLFEESRLSQALFVISVMTVFPKKGPYTLPNIMSCLHTEQIYGKRKYITCGFISVMLRLFDRAWRKQINIAKKKCATGTQFCRWSKLGRQSKRQIVYLTWQWMSSPANKVLRHILAQCGKDSLFIRNRNYFMFLLLRADFWCILRFTMTFARRLRFQV